MKEILPVVVHKAHDLGLLEDHEGEDRLREYWNRAAKYTHHLGNLRFGGYVLREEEGKLVDINIYRRHAVICPICKGLRTFRAEDAGVIRQFACESCGGKGELFVPEVDKRNRIW